MKKDRQPRQQRLVTPAPVHDERSRPQNQQAASPRKRTPPDNPIKTPAPVQSKRGSPGNVAGQRGARISKQEARTRKKVRDA